ncbi:hypothetical protein C1M51_02925 [Methylibium sp. Pch-M]|uniref:hypothetical protein n=1 Tax=Methylibium sp. Pch-M TaxID=2082386 RepID=UPI001013483F|nr:hypothetical protein [Methylibium sp. Pch-M]QAZ38458.1 hypothetical protein C1M51_02925 [Methylibium sp. Pch-M]
MNATVEDLRPTIIPKSDQLNAEQLLGGPMTVTVTDVRLGSSEEQPVIVHYANEGGRPFKPCKTMRKVLIHAWGADGRDWVGRAMTLYNDPAVKFGGEDVGGIRISHMTDIERDVKVSLTSTRGKKAKYEIRRLSSPVAGQLADITGAPTIEALKENFGAAYKATKDANIRSQFKAAYDARLKALSDAAAAAGTQPPGEAKKTYATLSDEIQKATDAEVASLILDEAREHLPAEQLEELAGVYRAKWSA